MKVVENATGNVLCFANFSEIGAQRYSTLDYTEDTDRPEDATSLATTPISGHDPDGDEGFKMLFDMNVQTKLCTDNRTPVIFSLAEAKALTGMSLLTANDNAGTGRVVPGFTLYGCETNSETDSDWTVVLDVEDAGMEGVKFTEYYYAIDGASAYQYYKLVFDGEDLFQYSELFVYGE